MSPAAGDALGLAIKSERSRSLLSQVSEFRSSQPSLVTSHGTPGLAKVVSEMFMGRTRTGGNKPLQQRERYPDGAQRQDRWTRQGGATGQRQLQSILGCCIASLRHLGRDGVSLAQLGSPGESLDRGR